MNIEIPAIIGGITISITKHVKYLNYSDVSLGEALTFAICGCGHTCQWSKVLCCRCNYNTRMASFKNKPVVCAVCRKDETW